MVCAGDLLFAQGFAGICFFVAPGARQRAETVVNICDWRAPARRNGGEYLRLARASAPKRW